MNTRWFLTYNIVCFIIGKSFAVSHLQQIQLSHSRLIPDIISHACTGYCRRRCAGWLKRGQHGGKRGSAARKHNNASAVIAPTRITTACGDLLPPTTVHRHIVIVAVCAVRFSCKILRTRRFKIRFHVASCRAAHASHTRITMAIDRDSIMQSQSRHEISPVYTFRRRSCGKRIAMLSSATRVPLDAGAKERVNTHAIGFFVHLQD